MTAMYLPDWIGCTRRSLVQPKRASTVKYVWYFSCQTKFLHMNFSHFSGTVTGYKLYSFKKYTSYYSTIFTLLRKDLCYSNLILYRLGTLNKLKSRNMYSLLFILPIWNVVLLKTSCVMQYGTNGASTGPTPIIFWLLNYIQYVYIQYVSLASYLTCVLPDLRLHLLPFSPLGLTTFQQEN